MQKVPFHIFMIEKLGRLLGWCCKYINVVKKKYLSRYLTQIYEPVIKKYNKSYDVSILNDRIPRIIWVLWWQGDYRTNRLVKCCIDRLKQFDFDLRILSKDNIAEYVDVSDVYPLYEKGLLRMAALADVVRFRLLAKYGGIWLDASIFVMGDSFLESVVSHGCFYSGHFENYPSWNNISGGKWTSYFLASCPCNPLMEYCAEAFVYCLNLHGKQIDYVIIDYTMATAYMNIPFFKTMIDRVPYNNNEIWALKGKLSKKFDSDTWKKITTNAQMLKFSVANDRLKAVPYKTYFDAMEEYAKNGNNAE